MGVEGRDRALGIFLGPAERAVPIPLEHHDEIGPHAPGRERIAEALRHGAEVLADGDAVPAPALLGDHRQHVGERQAEVRTLGGAKPVRDDIEPHQAEHMVDADRAGVAHGGAQHLPERLEASGNEAVRIVRGDAPVLAGGIELVGRRADRQSSQHHVLVHPGVGAAGVNADRGVEIEPDRHSAPPRDIAAAFELALGVPLQEFVKAEFVGMAFAQPAQRVVAGLPPFLRPLRPCAGMLLPQRFEGGEAFERAAALRPVGCEVGAALVAAVRDKIPIRRAQCRDLQGCNRRIIDQLGVAQPGNILRADLQHERGRIPRSPRRRCRAD